MSHSYTENHKFIMASLDEMKADIKEMQKDMKELSGIKVKVIGLGVTVSAIVGGMVTLLSRLIVI